MRYLEAEEVIVVNQTVANKSGEDHQVFKPNELHSAVYRHKQYVEIHDVTASLAHSVLNNHIFIQGNKRTALLSSLLILESEGFSLSMSSEKLADRFERMVTEKWPREKISAWIKRRIKS